MDIKSIVSFSAGLVRSGSPSSVELLRGRFPFMVIALFVFIGFSCAKQGFPPGGASDEKASFLVSSKPEANATNVSKSEPVVLEFSEPMDTKSVEDNLFIVPIPSFWPEYEWKSGDTVLFLNFAQPLPDNTTCVVSIGTKARDLRRNELEESIMLSFSTGDKIEDGKIEGKIIPYTFTGKNSEKISGVDVVAYRMDGMDSIPDPRNDVPDYATQSGADGTFEMIGLSRGVYRLFAIGDKDRDGFYSEGYDLIGISPHDVVIAAGDSLVYAHDLAVSERDTSGVQLVSISVPDSRRIELYFDRGIEPASIKVGIEGLDIIDWFITPENPGVISISTGEQEDGRRYTVGELNVSDRDGNKFQPMKVAPYFTGKAFPDTTALKIISWHPKILTPGKEVVRLVFNRVLALPDNPDEAIKIEPAVDLSVRQTASNELDLIPGKSWSENTNYLVSIDSEKVKGIAGNMLTGPGSQLDFRVVSSDTLGFIEGSIEEFTDSREALYRLTFKNIDTETVKKLAATGAQNWSTGPVLPGRYLCRAYRDDDSDGKLFRGTVYPFRVAEQVFDYPDTILVVSRWTNDDNNFIFR